MTRDELERQAHKVQRILDGNMPSGKLTDIARIQARLNLELVRELRAREGDTDRPEATDAPPIDGYRRLTSAEFELINEGKSLEARCLAFQKKVMRHLSGLEEYGNPEDKRRLREAFAHRWAQIGRTDIETGFMALTRAVAPPHPSEEE